VKLLYLITVMRKAQFPSKRNRLRCVRCIRALRALRLDGNRAKRKRLRWQAANHGCHCFDRASYWLLQRQYIVE